MTVSHLQLSNI